MTQFDFSYIWSMNSPIHDQISAKVIDIDFDDILRHDHALYNQDWVRKSFMALYLKSI